MWRKESEPFRPVPDSSSHKRNSQLLVRGWHSSKNAPIFTNPGQSRVCEHVRYPGNNLLDRSAFLIPPQRFSNRQEHEKIWPTPHAQLVHRNALKIFCQLIPDTLSHIVFLWGHWHFICQRQSPFYIQDFECPPFSTHLNPRKEETSYFIFPCR